MVRRPQWCVDCHEGLEEVQVHSMVGRLAQYTDIRAALVVGGLSLQAQATALRARPEIVVATPVRVRFLYLFAHNGHFFLSVFPFFFTPCLVTLLLGVMPRSVL